MRKAQMLATLITAVREARDVITKRHDLADAYHRKTHAEVNRLREEVGELADATRAVLERIRKPEPQIVLPSAATATAGAVPSVVTVTAPTAKPASAKPVAHISGAPATGNTVQNPAEPGPETAPPAKPKNGKAKT